MTAARGRGHQALAPDLAARIGAWAVAFEPSPPRLARVAASIADFDACTRAGARLPELQPALALAHPGAVGVPGIARHFDAASAALVAGTAGALLQLHDLHRDAGLHASAPVIPAAWAAAGDAAATTADAAMLRAIAAGYEVTHRFGLAGLLTRANARGAATATAGALGAAVAAALVAGLDAAGVARAVRNAALLLAATPNAAIRAHGALVPLHGGLAARAGVEAWRLAQCGDAGTRVLEGDGVVPGLVQLLHGDLRELQPEVWRGETLERIVWKFFPACFASHAALEAALQLPALDPARITRMTVRLAPRSSWLVDRGPDEGTLYDRLMSVRWVLARALQRRHYGPAVDLAPSTDTDALARRIRVVAARDLARLSAATLGADLEVVHAGERHVVEYRRAGEVMPISGPVGWIMQLDHERLAAKRAALLARASRG